MFWRMPDIFSRVRSTTQPGAFRRPWGYLYIAAFAVCFCWFFWYAADLITHPHETGAWPAAKALLIGWGPCYVLWIIRRIITGHWL